MANGASLDDMVRYSIDYSLDIRGNLTIWGGMEFSSDDIIGGIDIPKQRVARRLRPLYEYHRESPYTARIYQMEQELDGTISDEALIEALREFRQGHPDDGFGWRAMMVQACLKWCSRKDPEYTDEEKRLLSLRRDRDDEQEVLDRLLKQERQDILNLWGVDCPPDINLGENYQRRLMEGKGAVSEWFRQEFERIGGNWLRLYSR